ncbi:MAG: hypothetical protein U0835_00395 [Isosphaeraceae bacterium]
MDINAITMDRSAASKKAIAYKERLAQLKPSLSNAAIRAEYETALKGFEELAKGTKLIDLDQVMANCPLDEKFRPKLAIARHDRKQVKFVWKPWTTKAMFHTDFERYGETWTVLDSLKIDVNMGKTHNRPVETNSWGQRHTPTVEGYALVPMIPLDVRPKTGIPEKACILWEVEKWSDTRHNIAPDIDPYLLKPVVGSLYAVIAEWDLTELERAILQKRVTSTFR